MKRRIVPRFIVAASLIFSHCLAFAASPGDAVQILSVPPGLNVYIVPTSELTGADIDILKLTSQKFHAGKTPLKVSLAAGEYKVSIAGDNVPDDFRSDGEEKIIETLKGTGTALSMVRTGKIYNLIKREDRRGLVTALFWSRQQPVGSFMNKLPVKAIFKIRQMEDIFAAHFQKRSVPKPQWAHLLQMLEKTGKAVWFSENGNQHLFLYFTEINDDDVPTRFIIDPAE